MNEPARPRVSVLMPVYNAELYLAEALGSILAQEGVSFECIVVDDGSTDGTAALLEDFAQHDNRLTVISRPNTGIVGALNDGLARCRGEYLARMDADDVACPHRLARQCAFLDTHAECVGVGCWVDYLDPDGEHIWTWKMSGDPAHIEHDLLEGTVGGLVHPAMMLRRADVQSVGGYRPECQYVEDYDLFVRLLDRGSFSVVQECLLGYRQHPASINATRNRTERTAIKNQLLAEARRRRGLPEKILRPSPVSRTGAQLEWVNLALLDNNWRSARKTTRRLFKTAPLSLAPWRALGRLVRAACAETRIKLGAARQRVSKV
ncbi:MAG: glycosyltransferase [Verrucomicrobiota bacterium JB024]|nr:glycosyltransferase [Verrucomicrobiota bacterium JB024]